MIHAIGALVPDIHESAYVAWNAEVAGNILLGAGSSVWFSATLRGDIARIEVGEGSNIQDGSVLHVDTGLPCVVGKNVTVGHQVVLHSCTIGDGALIGMGVVVLNGAVIGEGCVVGAGALITQGKRFPPRTLILGSPAKVVRELTEEEVAGALKNAAHYVEVARAAKVSYRELR